MTGAVMDEKKTLFTCILDLYLKKKLLKYHIWSMAKCGAEISALR
jgi:hypothetical protein